MKVAIIHFRVGGTDGVSLEIAQWKEILERKSIQVVLIGGKESVGADEIIPGLEMDENINLADRLDAVMERYKPDRVIVSNIFSLGKNLLAAVGLGETLKKYNIKTIGVHHDFYWEKVRYKEAVNEEIKKLRETWLPPTGNWIKHVCINSLARTELWQRKKIIASVLPDCFDFNKVMDYKERIGDGNLIVLQATRLVRRKNIEIAMDLVAALEKRCSVTMWLSGQPEKNEADYRQFLEDYAKKLGIQADFIGDKINTSDEFLAVYAKADIVTYPSIYEGFGNQFLEAVWAKKPVVIGDYPVFKADIEPLGFETIKFGETAVDQIINLMKNETARQKMVETNFALGRANFSLEKCAAKWVELLA